MSNSANTYLGYWLIEPAAELYVDRFDSIPDLEYTHQGGCCGAINISVFLRGRTCYLRVRVQGYSETGEIDEAKNTEIFRAVSLTESVLRLHVNADIRFLPYVVATFYNANEGHHFEIKLTWEDAALEMQQSIFQKGMENVFSSENTANIYHLFVDGYDENIPLQFRYLSFYKILELLLKSNNKWNKADLERYIFIAGVVNARPDGVTRKTSNWIHDLRDQCAHIKNGQTIGVTHLNAATQAQISSALPILSRLCCAAMETMAKDLHSLTSDSKLHFKSICNISGRTLVAKKAI